MQNKRILTGDRPTGPLHLGHYIGSLQNRVKAQKTHDSFFVIADLHTLTTRPAKKQIGQLKEFVYQIVADILSEGALRVQDESRETLALVREAMDFPVFQVSLPREIPSRLQIEAFGGLAFM